MWEEITVTDHYDELTGREYREYKIYHKDYVVQFFVFVDILMANFDFVNVTRKGAKDAVAVFKDAFEWIAKKWNFDRCYFMGTNTKTPSVLRMYKAKITKEGTDLMGKPGLNLYMVEL